MASSSQSATLPVRPNNGVGKIGFINPWTEALKTLSVEEQKQFGPPNTDLLSVLAAIQEDTEKTRALCLKKGWTLYHDRQGEAVKLRHVLEKISVWVKAATEVVDVGVSFDMSGHAALPWGIVKYLIMMGFDDIAVFSQMSEAVELISGLIARYMILEKLYLCEDCESTPKLYEAICTLYAAVLCYLSKVRQYFDGNWLKKSARSLREVMTKRYEELQSKITEVNVEKWANLVDVELQRKLASNVSDHHEALKAMLRRLNQPIMQISDHVSQFQDRFNREDRKKVFEWISKIEYRKHHEDLSKGVLTGSGRWLLDSQEYVEWGQSSVSSILWLHGSPGSGKTRLVTTVIDQIFQAYPYLSVPPIAYFYCVRSEAERERGTPIEIIRAILRQLSSTEVDLPIKPPVLTEYKRRREKADQDGSRLRDLSMEDCVRLILELTDESPATIIIDALDECDRMLRYELLETLDEIVKKSKEIVKIFVSSREDIDIQLHLEHCRNVSIGASQNSRDIDRFIESELERLISKRLLLGGTVSQRLREKIAKTLSRGAQGMFRWVEMSLEVLCSPRIQHKADLSNALGKLPPKLSELYSLVYEQIDQTEVYGRAVAMTTLKWLLCAERLLKADELIAGVCTGVEMMESSQSATQSVMNNVYELSAPPESSSDTDSEIDALSTTDILRLTHNFITFDSQAQVFRFAHQSVLEYLQNQSGFSSDELQLFALESCLNVYIARPPRSKEPRTSDSLRLYALYNWPVHYQKSDSYVLSDLDRKERIMRFFVQDSQVSPAYIEWAEDIAHYRYKSTTLDKSHSLLNPAFSYQLELATDTPHSPLKAAYAFGFQSLMDEFDKLPTNFWVPELAGDNQVQSMGLLCIAAETNNTSGVKRLLEKGAMPEPKDKMGFQDMRCIDAPLCCAATKGYDKVVKLLIDTGRFDPNKVNGYGRTPLHTAAAEGYEAVVKVLLESANVNPNIKDRKGETPLHGAASFGGKEVVKLLLKNAKIDPNATCDLGCTPLFNAAWMGDIEVMKLLLETAEVDPNVGDQSGVTPLHAIAAVGSEESLRLLLESSRVDVQPLNNAMRTPIDIAVEYGSHDLIPILKEAIDKRANVS